MLAAEDILAHNRTGQAVGTLAVRAGLAGKWGRGVCASLPHGSIISRRMWPHWKAKATPARNGNKEQAAG